MRSDHVLQTIHLRRRRCLVDQTILTIVSRPLFSAICSLSFHYTQVQQMARQLPLGEVVGTLAVRATFVSQDAWMTFSFFYILLYRN